jgi:hypothetical protein
MLECQLPEQPVNGRGEYTGKIERIRFPNPLFGQYPQWQPEALPAEKSAGDLRVQLKSFTVSPQQPINHTGKTEFSVAFNPARPEEKWQLDAAELSDATGNRILSENRWALGQDGPHKFLGTLWPDESALRLKLGLKRISGFPAADLTAFIGLPALNDSLGLGFETNGTSLTNLVNGISVVVMNFQRITSVVYNHRPTPGPYWVTADLARHPPGVSVVIVAVATDAGMKLTPSQSDQDEPGANPLSPSLSWWSFEFLPAGAKFLNVTVAVQKERSVEFLAKPTELK